jgi:hypothetical protein
MEINLVKLLSILLSVIQGGVKIVFSSERDSVTPLRWMAKAKRTSSPSSMDVN